MKNIIKRALTVLLAGVFIFGLMGCSPNKTDKSTLDQSTWIVGLDDSFAPMGFRDEKGEIVGFDVDLAKALGSKLGKEIKFQPIDWSMKETELNAGNIDLIWNGYTITEARKEKVSFSNAYLTNSQVIVTLADSNIQTKADLNDKLVGAQNESSSVTAMEKDPEVYSTFKGGKAITFESNNDALMDLEAGRIDAVVADEILIRYYISLKGAEKYKILEDNFGDEQYGIGIRKNDLKMIEAFNTTYAELKAEGTVKAISEKWFGEDITS